MARSVHWFRGFVLPTSLYAGSFHEFSPIIKPLTESWTSASGKNVSYNVVVPSLPGFVFSSAPPANWTLDDTARIYNTLMTEVLGYSTYALHATDWVYSHLNLAVVVLTLRSRAVYWGTLSTALSTPVCAPRIWS
jgi:hypothetical protein